MKRLYVTFIAACLCLAIGTIACAQMNMNFFKRPAIAAIFHPVVGNGSVYQTTHTNSARDHGGPETLEMSVVGKELADGKEAYWLEFGRQETDRQGTFYGKVLISTDDFQMHRMIFEIPGQPAMEMPMNPSRADRSKTADDMGKWAQVGGETITVPAGTFICQHWKKDDGKSEIWSNDKISPLGMVKQVSPEQTQVLIKVLTDAKDHITGPVTKFDPRSFGQMMQQQQQPNQ